MKERFNANKYLGYRKAFPVGGYANIRRIFIWDKQKQRYVDPPRGNKFEARISGKSAKKRESRTFASLSEARDWLNGTVTTQELNLRTDGYTIQHLAHDWQRLGWDHLSKSTKIYYERMLPHLGLLYRVQVEDLHPKHIDEWLHHLKSPEMTSQFSSRRETFDRELDMFKTMIGWYIDRNDETKLRSPFKVRHKQMVRVRPQKLKPRKTMYEDELRVWLQELKNESFLFYAMAVVQVHQVLRVSEVSAMKWPNLSLSQREYDVSEHVIWPRNNGAPPEILPGTKTNRTGHSFKSFLQQFSVQVLSELQSLGKKGDLIFTLDGSVLTYRQIQHAYDSAFKRAGLPFSGTHVCRHTGATMFLAATGDVLALQQMGAWADHKMALHYGRIGSTRAKEAILNAEQKASLRIVRDESAS